MNDVIDTAAWTGRPWNNKLLLSKGLFKRATRVFWIKRPRGYPEGRRALAWGFEFGYDICNDWWSVEFSWGEAVWTHVFFTSQRLFHYRSRRAWK